MIVITEVRHEILKAIFTSEVEANEQALNLKKEDEKASEQQRSIESRLNLDVKKFDDDEDWKQSLIDSGPITLLELLGAVQGVIKDKTRELETCQKEDRKNLKKVIKTEREKEEWISDFLTKRKKTCCRFEKNRGWND